MSLALRRYPFRYKGTPPRGPPFEGIGAEQAGIHPDPFSESRERTMPSSEPKIHCGQYSIGWAGGDSPGPLFGAYSGGRSSLFLVQQRPWQEVRPRPRRLECACSVCFGNFLSPFSMGELGEAACTNRCVLCRSTLGVFECYSYFYVIRLNMTGWDIYPLLKFISWMHFGQSLDILHMPLNPALMIVPWPSILGLRWMPLEGQETLLLPSWQQAVFKEAVVALVLHWIFYRIGKQLAALLCSSLLDISSLWKADVKKHVPRHCKQNRL